MSGIDGGVWPVYSEWKLFTMTSCSYTSYSQLWMNSRLSCFVRFGKPQQRLTYMMIVLVSLHDEQP